MNYWPHSNKVIKASVQRQGFDPIKIYRGYDFDLLYTRCKDVCKNGFKEGDNWWPPHSINRIILEVEDYDGSFTEWEEKCMKAGQLFEREKQQNRLLRECKCTQCGTIMKKDEKYEGFLCPNCGATHSPSGKFLGNTFFVRGEGNESKDG